MLTISASAALFSLLTPGNSLIQDSVPSVKWREFLPIMEFQDLACKNTTYLAQSWPVSVLDGNTLSVRWVIIILTFKALGEWKQGKGLHKPQHTWMGLSVRVLGVPHGFRDRASSRPQGHTLSRASPPLTVSMAKASALSLAWSTAPSPSMRAASARDSASALAVPVLSTAVLRVVQRRQGGPGGSPAPPSSILGLCCRSVSEHTRAHAHTLPPSAALPRPSSIFPPSSPPTSGPPAPRVLCELSQLPIGLRSSASQAGHGLLVLVFEPRALVGEETGKTLGVGPEHELQGPGALAYERPSICK